MASTFPGAIDNFTDPLSNSSLSSPSHAGQHSDLNDAVEKVETYMGLVKVIPTGATNGTVGATGTVTIGNAVSSVTVSGAFSSLYNVYKIVMNGGVASTLCSLDFQFASISAGYYGGWTGTKFDTGAVSGLGVNNASKWSYTGWGNTFAQFMELTVFNANIANRKYCTGGAYLTAGGIYGTFVGETTGTSAETGFIVSASTGTLTGGSIRVYGYRN